MGKDEPWLEEMDEGGDARKGESADENGGVETSMTLFLFNSITAFLIE